MFDTVVITIFISFYVFTGLFIFSSFHKHLLMTLLGLEYIMLNIFLLLVLILKAQTEVSYLLLVFLVFTVAEGSVGLSVLISLVRSHGNDMVKSFSILW